MVTITQKLKKIIFDYYFFNLFRKNNFTYYLIWNTLFKIIFYIILKYKFDPKFQIFFVEGNLTFQIEIGLQSACKKNVIWHKNIKK